MRIVLEKREITNPESSLRREWIDTNGIGGYASSTVLDCHTRRYHGLLVIRHADPPGRYVLLSRIEATLITDSGVEFPLTTCKYPGVLSPTGYRYLERFEQGLAPSSTYRADGCEVRRSVMMVQGEHTVLVHYEILESTGVVTLRLLPLLAFRGIHELQRKDAPVDLEVTEESWGFSMRPRTDLPPLHITVSRQPSVNVAPLWHYNVEYLKDMRRGFHFREDLFTPGTLEIRLDRGESVIVCASTQPHGPRQVKRLLDEETKRRVAEYETLSGEHDPHVRALKHGAGQFFVKTEEGGDAVVAGWHWFGPRGRDTLVALPGLAFVCGRGERGLSVLRQICRYEHNGLLPDWLPENGEAPFYRSVDTSLWLFWTLQEYLRFGGDRQTVRREFLPVMTRIVAAHVSGKVEGCRLTEEGFLAAGDETTARTWMDAQVAGVPVTSRHGCAVEVAALWYNAVKFWLNLTEDSGEDELRSAVSEIAQRIEESFVRCFWNESERCLGDVYREGWLDGTVRPNQILAVSLPNSPLSFEDQRAVVACITAELLTPFGLRTLAPSDSRYLPRYEGNQESRDRAMHQGTVWPWLAAHYADAYLRTCADRHRGVMFLTDRLRPLLRAFPDTHAIASLPEMYNGNPPHVPKGCVAQAWSVAEVLRIHHILREPRAPAESSMVSAPGRP